MEQQQPEKMPESGRKRKMKFSEKEQEVLIEEVVPEHDKLFGKKALRVPEATKRKIWLGIQQKVNACGVQHRTIEDLRKRFYDMRQRSKERLAGRLKEATKTGGGASTSSDSTPHEELLEQTLLPESVAGVTDIDSSEATRQAQVQQQNLAQDAGEEEVEESEQVVLEDSSDDTEATTMTQKRRRIRVPTLTLMEAEEHGHREDDEGGAGAAQDIPSHNENRHRHHAASKSGRRSRPKASGSEGGEATVFAGLERSMLRTQELQHKAMRSINRQLNTLNKTVKEMALSITGVLTTMCHTMVEEQASRRRERLHHQHNLNRYTKAVNRLCVATSLQNRRSQNMQTNMVHCCQDMARGLAQVTAAVEQLQTATSGGAVLMAGTESEETASRSSTTPPVPEIRRRSGRNGHGMGASPLGEQQPVRARGGRARRH